MYIYIVDGLSLINPKVLLFFCACFDKDLDTHICVQMG